jgi:formylglycine-generating enzyme required for sulfatase activity
MTPECTRRRELLRRWVGLLGAVHLLAATVWAQPPKIITGHDGAPMVLIPAGEFTMGSEKGDDDEKPIHSIYLDAFYLDTYEVTIAQYAHFLEGSRLDAPPRWHSMNQLPHQKRPVVNIDWTEASTYCGWAGKRLPTEAEWEKAARGTDGRMYPWGNGAPNRRRANYGKREWNNHVALEPVGSLEDGKSPYGVYDMAGNVWEWTADWYEKGYYLVSPDRNPKGPEHGEEKVVRGGDWFLTPGRLRATNRDGLSVMGRNLRGGFRCAKTP